MSADEAERDSASASERVPIGDHVWGRIEAAVWRVVRRSVAPAEREEIAQQIFLRILENIQALRDRERLDAWTTRVAVNIVWSTFRTRKRWRRLVVPADEAEMERASYVVDFEVRERIASAYSALETLPPHQRRLLEERWLDEKGAMDVAARERCSPTTAKRRLRKAQRLLNAAFARTRLRPKPPPSR